MDNNENSYKDILQAVAAFSLLKEVEGLAKDDLRKATQSVDIQGEPCVGGMWNVNNDILTAYKAHQVIRIVHTILKGTNEHGYRLEADELYKLIGNCVR